jgi:hypothetical protein
MKKQRERCAQSPVRQPIRDFIKLHKGRRFVLDLGHLVIIGDGRSTTTIITTSGDAVCHSCGY